MLVLTRCSEVTKPERSEVVIETASGERIVVRLVRLMGDRARVAIEAGPDVRILRGEIENEAEPMGQWLRERATRPEDERSTADTAVALGAGDE